MCHRLRTFIATGLVCLIGGLAMPARAWVCSRALDGDGRESGPSLSWATRTIRYAVASPGTADLPDSTEVDVLEDSFSVWEGVSECSPPNRQTDIQFTRVERTSERDLIGYDFLDPAGNENLLVFRDAGWPHQSRIIALTTTSYSAQTGEIFDADIEFNSGEPSNGFDFADLNACCPGCDPVTRPGSACAYTDLMNTAVHEIGHILGLGHPDDWSDIDPSCSADSTMCATAELGDTNKRTLECDDRDALVFKYPAGAANGYCQAPACAEGLEACGACGDSACAPWIGCGFCAPPNPLHNDVTIRAVGFDNGLEEGCACQTGRGLTAVGLLLLAGLGRRRLRTPDRRR